MTVIDSMKQPHNLTRLGLVFLVLANLAMRFLPRLTGWSDGPTDAVVGLLYGIAIPLLLISVARRRQRQRTCE